VTSKKCPECFGYIPAEAVRCPACGVKVGKAGAHGMAKKPINWKAYLVCLLSWIVFVLYMWWAFF